MKNNILKILLMSAAFASLAGCEGPADIDPETRPEDSVSLSADSGVAPVSGDEIKVTVTSSGTWTIHGTYPWVRPDKTSGENGEEITFTIDPNPEQVVRTATFTVNVGNVFSKFTVTYDIAIALDLSNARAYPQWTNADVVNGLEEFTVETLVNFSEYHNLATLFGIEGHFIVRVGDTGADPSVPVERIQVIYRTLPDNEGKDGEVILSNENMRFSLKTWHHIAVTFASDAVRLYIDGELKGENTAAKMPSVSFGVPHTNEEYPDIVRCFWMGYSCDQNRYMDGKIAEFRIWNKVLDATTLGNVARRYSVDPASEGLVSYWKFNEGEGYIVKDRTANGNDVYCETDIVSYNHPEAWSPGCYGTPNAKWVAAKFPDLTPAPAPNQE